MLAGASPGRNAAGRRTDDAVISASTPLRCNPPHARLRRYKSWIGIGVAEFVGSGRPGGRSARIWEDAGEDNPVAGPQRAEVAAVQNARVEASGGSFGLDRVRFCFGGERCQDGGEPGAARPVARTSVVLLVSRPSGRRGRRCRRLLRLAATFILPGDRLQPSF